MFSREITPKISLRLTVPQFADEIYKLTDKNRTFLRQWLPWLDHVTGPEHTKAFFSEQLEMFVKGEALNASIYYEDTLVGIVGFNSIDKTNRIGYIGYWLAEGYNGKGIMSACVRDLISLGEEYYFLQKVDIRCATDNHKSRAIPERLGFTHKGSLGRAEWLYDHWVDLEVYELLLGSEEKQRASLRTNS